MISRLRWYAVSLAYLKEIEDLKVCCIYLLSDMVNAGIILQMVRCSCIPHRGLRDKRRSFNEKCTEMANPSR